MAIKDALINEILKSQTSAKSSEILYKRLREVPTVVSQNETKHKPNTNETKTEHDNKHKLFTNQTQTNDKLTTRENTNFTQTNLKVITNRTQTLHRSKHESRFMDLIGIQKTLMVSIYENCKKNGARVTDPITLEELAEYCQIKIYSIKTSVCRLEKKLVLIRAQFKNGRGGWTIYEVPEHIYQEIYQAEVSGKLNTKLTQTEHNPNTELNTEKIHYNNSNKNIITIDDGEKIDFSCIPKIKMKNGKEVYFTQGDLDQILNANKLSKEQIQESIYKFAWGIENKTKTVTYDDPLRVFVGSLCKGIVWGETGYISKQEIALREELERRRAEQERIKKLEEELRNLEFNNWEKNLDEDQRRKISPRGFVGDMKAHFNEKIWPEIKKNLEN